MHPIDPYERADFRRKQLAESFACPSCKSPDPAIIRGRVCSDCPDGVGDEVMRLRRREIVVEANEGYIVTAEESD